MMTSRHEKFQLRASSGSLAMMFIDTWRDTGFSSRARVHPAESCVASWSSARSGVELPRVHPPFSVAFSSQAHVPMMTSVSCVQSVREERDPHSPSPALRRSVLWGMCALHLPVTITMTLVPTAGANYASMHWSRLVVSWRVSRGVLGSRGVFTICFFNLVVEHAHVIVYL